MSNIAITVENLSKLYRIGMREQKHDTFIGALTSWATLPLSNYRRLRNLTHFNSLSGPQPPAPGPSSLVSGLRSPVIRQSLAVGNRRSATTEGTNLLWALKDVSFEIKQGEAVGIIGRNGAGKSTLLKVLSRITEPTSGRAIINGRVASLLEVGTGFHPDLTGRENICLNGAILGMTRRELGAKFDEIVAFAEVAKFIDTPVKYYSSGMYVRLAFSVAAHLEPEILLVDEVLAVGDVAFQQKCLQKMDDVTSEGRTVVFVSHNMAAILNLSKKAVLLGEGRVVSSGDVREVVKSYLDSNIQMHSEAQAPKAGHKFGDEVNFRNVRVLDSEGKPKALLGLHEGVNLEIEYVISEPVRSAIIFFRIENSSQIKVLTSTDVDSDPNKAGEVRKPGHYVARCFVSPQYLRPGKYIVDLECGIPSVRWLDRWPHAIAFEVVDTGSVSSKIVHGREGVIAPVLGWETHVANSGDEEAEKGGESSCARKSSSVS